MNSQSIEFDEEKNDSSLPKMVRTSFRVPVEDNENTGVQINGKRYSIIDISMNAVGIAIKGDPDFSIDQELRDCELILFDTTIKELHCKVVRLTVTDQKVWIYGIQWINMKDNDIAQVSKIVKIIKEQLLNDDDITVNAVLKELKKED